jgi:DNA-binding NarL/FixJ family response regulator
MTAAHYGWTVATAGIATYNDWLYLLARVRPEGCSQARTVTLNQSEAGSASLTPREREVLALVAKGKCAREIGEILHITKRTVDEHVQTTVRKLGALNRTHAAVTALRRGVIEV